MGNEQYAIEMLNITKRFPGIIANDNITLQLRHGEIHALLGENGAGKSTLMSVLFGLYQAEEGIIKKDGVEVKINDPNDANALGIGMVHQHFKLVECFTVLENIILGVEPNKAGFLQMDQAREKVMKLSEQYGLHVDPDALIEDITVGMQQRTEILKMLYRDNEILIFDEPTAVLTPQEIEELADTILHNPAKVSVTPPATTVEAIEQSVYFVDKENKRRLLIHLLQNPEIESALVFTRTKHGANRVAQDLTKAGITAAAIHGNKSQTARQAALAGFKDGSVRVLVATDIAARGLDIESLGCVFNYNLPEVPETYVHRIGRTGRAGKDGIAISFCDYGEKPLLRDIETLIGKSIPVVEDHPFPMQIFEAPVKDARGRVVNPEDAEARAAAKARKAERQEILSKLKVGMRLKGTVSSIVDFGAFVDLGGIDGLVHISELSWNHVNHPSEVVKVGQEVEVQVLDVDLNRERISLGLKQTTEDPWRTLVKKYPVDAIVEGKVTKLVTFGAFVDLGDGVDGLVHISEMAKQHVDQPSQVCTVGDTVQVKVMEIDLDRRRISLSMKAAAETLGTEVEVKPLPESEKPAEAAEETVEE